MKIEIEIGTVPSIACPECENLLDLLEEPKDGDN